jgi:hypothetical protein
MSQINFFSLYLTSLRYYVTAQEMDKDTHQAIKVVLVKSLMTFSLFLAKTKNCFMIL